MLIKTLPILLCMLALVLQGCPSLGQKVASERSATERPKKEAAELQVEELEVGTGQTPKDGQQVRVHYVGRLKNGKVFDSSIDRGEQFTFTLGKGEVIKGWEEAVQVMKVGGKYKVTIPPHMGYGKKGSGSKIPPNSTLIFEIELLGVH